MNRKELIKEVSKCTGLDRDRVSRCLQMYEEIIGMNLKEGKDIHLHGFVTFKVKKQREKKYYNPHTQIKRNLEPHNSIKVSVSSRLNNMLNEKTKNKGELDND